MSVTHIIVWHGWGVEKGMHLGDLTPHIGNAGWICTKSGVHLQAIPEVGKVPALAHIKLLSQVATYNAKARRDYGTDLDDNFPSCPCIGTYWSLLLFHVEVSGACACGGVHGFPFRCFGV